MKKLRLEIDNLRVESFGTGAGARGGTVAAHFGRPPITLPTDETTHDPSRADSCYYDTCYYGCPWTD